MCFQLHDSEPAIQAVRGGGGGGILKMSPINKKRLLFCSLCFPTEWEWTSTDRRCGGFSTKQNRGEKGEAWLGFSQVGFTRRESGDALLFPSPSISLLFFPLCSHPSPQPKNLRAALNPLSVVRHRATCAHSSLLSATQRCFRAEISGRVAVYVLGQTCPSSDMRADSDSDWATDQDPSLLSPLLPSSSILTWHVSVPQICTGRYEQFKVRLNPRSKWERERNLSHWQTIWKVNFS